jgi:hypothetical protein
VVGSYVPFWSASKAVMCPSARGFVVGSNVPFWLAVGGRLLCAFLVDVWL